ncbi:MAG: anthranilate phosphoribosyltransferase [Planctomycetes bacterium]|nr:anthranilate phosphoribosyltransferase [Planctomycetota bacterium]
MIPALIDRLLAGERPDPSALEDVFQRILGGQADPIQVSGLLVALRSIPLDSETLAACASVLRQHRRAVRCQVRPLIDTCGTGGDGSGTFNISTGAALAVAAAGGAVAKHGNRSVSSKTGSADVLETLGVRLEVPPNQAARIIDATGFAFLFAPLYHPVMAHVMPVRRALGIRTLFNMVGPLSNPALAEFQVLGVFDAGLTEVMAGALKILGTRGALVVHCGGLDEIGIHDVTHGHRLLEDRIEPWSVSPEDVGIARAPIEDLLGGEADENAAILRKVLEGESGPRADVVALNAGAACWVGGLAGTLADGVALARETLANGGALRVLERACESTARALDGDDR